LSTIIHIKNMVCPRCIRVVIEELENIGLSVEDVKLGEARVRQPVSEINFDKLKEVLINSGFELLDDRKTRIIEKIKNIIINEIHQKDEVDLHINFSHLIQENIGMDYHYLSSLFSATEGITIEKYTILQRIERAKELLIYNELTLSEIAWKLGYSSVQHLSSQFRKVIGLTPTEFKKLHSQSRNPLDKVGQ